MACKKEPKDFGFDVNEKKIKDIKKFKKTQELQESSLIYWR